MAISLRHSKVSTKADGTDSTAVRPSDWNAEHNFTAAAGKVLGTLVGSTTVTELPIAVDASGQSMTPPSGTTAARPAAPSAGMMRYNSTTSLIEAYLSGAWQSFESFPSGTKMLFQQTSAPTGWTKDTTHNDKALRVVSGSVGAGGSLAFSAAFTSRTSNAVTVTGTVGNTTLTVDQIPSHSHTFATGGSGSGFTVNTAGGSGTLSTSSTGGGQSHTHSFTGGSHSHTLDMTVQYVDLIIATKN